MYLILNADIDRQDIKIWNRDLHKTKVLTTALV